MNWLEDEQYRKIEGIFRLQLNKVMEPFRMYGLSEYIPGAIDEVVKLAVDFSLVMRGKDKPVSIDYVRRKR